MHRSSTRALALLSTLLRDEHGWFKLDKGWYRHEKVRDAGKDGRALWTTTGNMLSDAAADGIVLGKRLRDYAHYAEVSNPSKVAARLVEVGLWHDHKTIKECDHCSGLDLQAGDFYFHDWDDHNEDAKLDESPLARERRKRARALNRNGGLKEAIVGRDKGRCRYCGIRVNFADRKGATGGTYDHVDPDGTNAMANVVVACRRCNGIKRDRTPDEAGMVLLFEGCTEDLADRFREALKAANGDREKAERITLGELPPPRKRRR